MFAPRFAASILALTITTLAAQTAPEPLRELPYRPVLDLSSMDRTQDACVDFYQFSCGGWMKANPIPADESGWSVYAKLQAATDPHSPPRHRVNGVVANLPAFAKAFACQPGQPMARVKPCEVW